jgi:hypothetical protein
MGSTAPWPRSGPRIPLLAFSVHMQLALVLGRAAPHPVHLAGGQRELQALAAHPARGADLLGPSYLVPGRPVRGDREEKLRIRLQTGGSFPPVEPPTRRRPPLGGYLGNNHKQPPESLLPYLHW